MKSFLRELIVPLVRYPEDISIRSVDRNRQQIFEIRVAAEDMGRVIGKGGQVANAIRTLLKVAAAREGQQVNLDIVEPY